jgi:ABC-type transport system involved in multi-copper enzyme maturation permease subunit
VGSGWSIPALGVGVLAGIPVVIIVAGITLLGLPVALMLFALYLAALYLAKLWVGAFLGRTLLKSSGATKGDWMLGLLVGLLILTIVGLVPYLGGLVHWGCCASVWERLLHSFTGLHNRGVPLQRQRRPAK